MIVRFGLAAGLVSVAAIADLYIGLRAGPTPLAADELQDGRRALEARMKRGDVIVHSPLFGVEEARHLDGLRARPDLPVEAVRKGRRILLLDRRDVPMGGFRAPDDRITVSPHLFLAIFEPKESAEIGVHDLAIDLGPKTMRVERPRKKTVSRCRTPRPEGGYACPGQAEWIYAARRTLRIDGRDRECVWAHPINNGAVVLTVPALEEAPAGRELILEVQGGLTDDAVRQTPSGAGVTTAVVQSGRTLGKLSVPNRIGWRTFSASIRAGASVDLVTTTPRDGRRHYCVSARVVEREAEKEAR